MGIKEIIQRWKEKKSEQGDLYREMEMRRRVEKLILEREKSSEERELERFIEEGRQKRIKQILEKKRKVHGKDFFPGKFLFKHKNNFENGASMLRSPNLFKDNENIFNGQEYLFK